MAWRQTHMGREGDEGRVGGLSVWKHPWRPLGAEVRVPEGAPTGSQETYWLYEICGVGWPVPVRFAAAEVSNGVWSFWEEA